MSHEPMSKQIAAYAYRYWKARRMEEWPTIRQVARRFRMKQRDVEEGGAGYYDVVGYNVEDYTTGDLEVHALTDDVDRAWCEYYMPVNRRCTCKHHHPVDAALLTTVLSGRA